MILPVKFPDSPMRKDLDSVRAEPATYMAMIGSWLMEEETQAIRQEFDGLVGKDSSIIADSTSSRGAIFGRWFYILKINEHSEVCATSHLVVRGSMQKDGGRLIIPSFGDSQTLSTLE